MKNRSMAIAVVSCAGRDPSIVLLGGWRLTWALLGYAICSTARPVQAFASAGIAKDQSTVKHFSWIFAVLIICLAAPALAQAQPKPPTPKERNPMIHKTGFVHVNRANLYYEVRRSTRAAKQFPPVILVHGLSLDNRMWDSQLRVLLKFFLTYRYDMRGHGQSDPATGPVGIHDDLIGFMDALGIEKAHLVGLSLGGNAVTEVAATHPERVEKVVLVDSGINGFQYPTPNVLQRIPAYLDINNTQGRDAALKAWAQDPLFAVSYRNPRIRPVLEEIVLNCSCSLFFNPQFQIRPPTFSRLGQITSPTLVLIGELDSHEFQAAADALDQNIPNSVKVVVPGAGHIANLDKPVLVTVRILEFLNQGDTRWMRTDSYISLYSQHDKARMRRHYDSDQSGEPTRTRRRILCTATRSSRVGMFLSHATRQAAEGGCLFAPCIART